MSWHLLAVLVSEGSPEQGKMASLSTPPLAGWTERADENKVVVAYLDSLVEFDMA